MNQVLFNLHDVVLLMTTYLCVLFAVLLLTLNREKRLSNTLLALFLLSQAAIPLELIINFGEAFREWALSVSPNLFHVFRLAYWLEGPLLLWYVRSMIYKNYRLRPFDAVYLLPFLAYLLFEIFYYFRFDTVTKTAMLKAYSVYTEPLYVWLIDYAREILRVVFGIMCLVEIHHYRSRIRHEFSNIEKIDYSWLNLLVMGFLAVRIWATFVTLALLLSVTGKLNIDFAYMGLVGNYATFLLVSFLIYFNLKHSPVVDGVEIQPEKPASPKQTVDPDQIERLTAFMNSEKPYLQNTLTLEQLAKSAGMSPRALSNIINRHFDRNFFEFVNHYRIEEARQQLRDPACKHKSVLDIMLDVGFNSKATFNTFFKKIVGSTPSTYRKNALTANSNQHRAADG